MTVEEVMTQPVVTCSFETSLVAAAALMSKYDCGALPVVAETGEILGIVTDRDVCLALGTRNACAADLYVRDLIQDNIFICQPGDDIQTALLRMRRGRIRRLPVINEKGRLEGILSIDDVALSAKADDSNGVSYEEVVTTLQVICAGDQPADRRSAAA